MFLPINTTSNVGRMTSVVSYVNQNLSYRVNVDQEKQNLVWVSREFELSKFQSIKLKGLKSVVKSKGNRT